MKTIKLPTGTFEYDPGKPLGRRGGFGQVFAGKSASGGEVAVKKLHLSAADAAPEQWRGERATHATDVYALGCIAFCLLTGLRKTRRLNTKARPCRLSVAPSHD